MDKHITSRSRCKILTISEKDSMYPSADNTNCSLTLSLDHSSDICHLRSILIILELHVSSYIEQTRYFLVFTQCYNYEFDYIAGSGNNSIFSLLFIYECSTVYLKIQIFHLEAIVNKAVKRCIILCVFGRYTQSFPLGIY